tara:strand:+ start:190 stop:414 length:225 start_codon:yes stop_codon:yes gene_type:complete
MAWKDKMPEFTFKKFRYSRACFRNSLSKFLNIQPLNIPLNAAPGKAPLIGIDNLLLSMSHSENLIFFAYSSSPI